MKPREMCALCHFWEQNKDDYRYGVCWNIDSPYYKTQKKYHIYCKHFIEHSNAEDDYGHTAK